MRHFPKIFYSGVGIQLLHQMHLKRGILNKKKICLQETGKITVWGSASLN